MPVRRSGVECAVKPLILTGRGLAGVIAVFADNKAPGDLTPKLQALNLLENKIICST